MIREFGLIDVMYLIAAARWTLALTATAFIGASLIGIVIAIARILPFAPLRWLYQNVALRALPLIARLSASNPIAYEYLAESILAWPAQRPLADKLAAAGWRDVSWKNLTGGIVALHRAVA